MHRSSQVDLSHSVDLQRRKTRGAIRAALFCAICASLWLCSFSYIAAAHKFYVSITQIEYNQQEKSAEIIIRIFADDLESALGKRTGRSVKIGQATDFDQLALGYLRDTFELKNGSGRIVRFNWVGKEVQTDMVWIYIEAKMPEGLIGAQLRNRILFDVFSDQVNIVNTKYNGKQVGLMYQQRDGFKPIMERQEAAGTPRG